MIHLKDFVYLNNEEIILVWKWRNDKVTHFFMKTKNFSLKEHKEFIKNLQKDTNKKYFLVFKDDKAIGVIDFIRITLNSCEFGLYAKPHLKGVGQILMNEIKKYAFEILKIKALKACVFKNNEKALKLYKNNDFTITKEDEEFFYIILHNPNCKALLS
ncbi:UDP-4-amino-4,6-dideoxy-N-acetyl-beta-L-altrosamine N-acetyltransferase [Campylobacter jejuni]|nr:UDP-4-amino-4,6-dideoxy-N-acetyl-beta-L-altrosamine N-acetyltransferase [Campylobacter jejuni]EHR0430054.1 UDP-4-amino-4,6-dideoxy-N-acetyl-beta-L-altrosamine N-acetyltransferase [Campylobacter jejuni]HEC1710435.1 UDP-4-amino-4,6-dideoxy-N-acetyl-beta-L-altrosamine N-acetyltransferase [Campylobacter jejuni]HEC3410230.1 UDP-4-amino-4,6-dideoxy-N-acetyl-beta-L-altrosamine N-acetyltransferase [Campylobacter jejuni]HEF8052583.1 UDP-4-amino-4,6-dideoxy-N-acetyl-beta-L-altrosamine N-acetyltransfer